MLDTSNSFETIFNILHSVESQDVVHCTAVRNIEKHTRLAKIQLAGAIELLKLEKKTYTFLASLAGL